MGSSASGRTQFKAPTVSSGPASYYLLCMNAVLSFSLLNCNTQSGRMDFLKNHRLLSQWLCLPWLVWWRSGGGICWLAYSMVCFPSLESMGVVSFRRSTSAYSGVRQFLPSKQPQEGEGSWLTKPYLSTGVTSLTMFDNCQNVGRWGQICHHCQKIQNSKCVLYWWRVNHINFVNSYIAHGQGRLLMDYYHNLSRYQKQQE